MRDKLGAADPTVQRALNGKTPADAAKAYIDGTKLDDPAVRKQLYQGGAAAIAASTDPLIVLMRDIDPRARDLRKQWDDKVDAVLRTNSARIAKARFALQGTNSYPDATFTLRLSYGTVKSYQEQGTHIPAYTTIGGAFEHASANGNKGDFKLPKSWEDAKDKLDLKTPMNFVHTADTIGGNSGSPTVDRNGEVVGILFDGNIESLPWDFAYDDKVGRSISVDSRAILESIRKGLSRRRARRRVGDRPSAQRRCRRQVELQFIFNTAARSPSLRAVSCATIYLYGNPFVPPDDL